MNTPTSTWIAFGIYLGATFLLAWLAHRQRSGKAFLEDFFVAGRQLGLVVTVIAGVSSIMSGFGFVGGPGLVFGR